MEIVSSGRSVHGRTSKLVKHTAKEMAGAFFDGQDMFHDGRVERSTLFRIKARNQREFVNTYWRDFVPIARKTLAGMLSDPGRSQEDKDAIYDALLEERGAMTDAEQVAPSIVRLN
jgi:hypothetical protein